MRQCFGDYPQDHNVVCGRVFPCCFGPCIFQFPTRKVINKGNAQKRTPVAWMNSLIAAMANTKTNLWGCKQRQQMFLLIACSHGNQGHFLPWIVNTNVSTCITVQNLACLDCLHLFVAVAIVFPLTTPSDCNKCAEWFTDSVTDDATNPTRKISESFWNRFFRWHESSKQQVKSEDSGLCLWSDLENWPEFVGWQSDLQRTVSNVFAKKWVKVATLQLQLFRCDVGNRFEKSCIVNIRFAPKQLTKTKASLIFGGSTTHCFTCLSCPFPTFV